jgi:hypothetical protein
MLLFFSVSSSFPGDGGRIHCIWVLCLPARARRGVIILVLLRSAPIEVVATLTSFLVLLLVVCSAVIRVDGTFPQPVPMMSLRCLRPLLERFQIFDINARIRKSDGKARERTGIMPLDC